MEWLNKINWRDWPVWKIVSSVIGGAIILVFVIWLVGFATRTALFGTADNVRTMQYDGYSGFVGKDVINSESPMMDESLSVRNIAPTEISGGIAGNLAESYETKEYTGNYETRNLSKLCDKIESLKPLDYVIFENANRGDRNCQYYFKVKNEKAEDVRLAVVELNPKYFVSNIESIKNVLDDYTSRELILEKKLESVEETLAEAQTSYDELRRLATATRDAESLSKVIESKINLIERLTNERLNTRAELVRIGQSKALQTDRLEYTYFRLYVYENPIVDWKNVRDSWVAELQQFVREFNGVIQGITIKMLSFGLKVAQVALYTVIAIFVVKYGWRLGKFIWRV